MKPMLVLVAFALTGCFSPSSNDNGNPDIPSPSSSPQTTSSPPGTSNDTTPLPAELLNESYEYPRLRMGAPASGEFEVPAGFRFLQIHLTAVIECPVTVVEGPQLRFTSPNGTVTSRPPAEALQGQMGSVQCPGEPARTYETPTFEVLADPGTWAVETSGECTCSVRAIVVGSNSELSAQG